MTENALLDSSKPSVSSGSYLIMGEFGLSALHRSEIAEGGGEGGHPALHGPSSLSLRGRIAGST